MKYQTFSANEWIYPDSLVDETGSRQLSLHAARGGYAAGQILLNGVTSDTPIEWSFRGIGELPEPEVYQLLQVYVEKNTGPVGFHVKEGESAEGYTTRKAPFWVYDAINPVTEKTRTRSHTEGIYVCWPVPTNALPGSYTGQLILSIGGERCEIPVQLEIFPALIPAKETLSVINWFSLSHMASRYGLDMWSEAHWTMICKYGELMRRARQTHFWVPMEVIDVERKAANVYKFDFSKAERLIRLYLELGFSGIEGGLLAGRQDFWGSEFVIWNKWEEGGGPLKAISFEGYAYLSQFLPAWRSFLEENGWLGMLLQHVADEPTENSKQEYRILSGIVRKYMPGVPLLEAVETHDLGGAVDIWIPKNVYYQEHREAFEQIRATGDRLWFYTCCFPGGYYLNRLWDMPLIRTRYLHWGNYKYDMDGFLHWGLNHCDPDKDPYHQTDLVFPAGDTHIVYPGENGPIGSMRLEAMRAGIEDYELLRITAARDKALADDLTAACLTSFNEADENPLRFADTQRRLLAAASQ